MQEAIEPTLGTITVEQGVQVLWDYWRAGGWLMVPLGIVSFLIWYSYFSLRHRLKEQLSTPPSCLDTLEERLVDGQSDLGIDQWLAGLPGATARIVRHVLAWGARGMPFRKAYGHCREAELGGYSHSFLVLGALVAAAPLLGLVGTVLGMIDTFDAVAARSGETAVMVAGGISQALITTQVGLVAALPGTFGLAHIMRLRKHLASDLDRCECQLHIMLENGTGAERSHEKTK